MLSQNDIVAILEAALKITQKGAQKQNSFSLDLKLFGKEGIFDSLDAMIFLDSLDDLLSAKTGKPFALTTEDVFSEEKSPFQTMQTLADYIARLVNQG